MKLPYRLVASTAATAFFLGHAHAQTPPDAGALQQQIERDIRPALPPQAKPLKPAEPPPLKLPAGATVTVKAFRFAGNTLLDAAQLAPVVESWLARPLGFAQLQEAAAAVAEAYRAAGWIVRAYLPKQDITDGIVTIQIVEAVYGGAMIEGADPLHLKVSTVLSHAEAQQKTGEPLNAEALDRGLLLADDLPGVTVAGTLQAGQKAGETGLALKLADEPLLVGELGIDNTGSHSTGEQQATLMANFNSPLGLGDLLAANIMHSQGNDYYRLAYTVPAGSDGWRLGANASRLDYRLVAPEFEALRGAGESGGYGLTASYPLIRSRQRNLYLFVAHDRKQFHNEASDAVQSDYAVESWNLAFSGNGFDNLGGGGANAFSLALTAGRIDLGQRDAGENAELVGAFEKLRYSLSRQQAVTPQISLFAALSGQHAREALDSSERFFLGGPNGVRAYPANEGGGDRGQLVNFELRWRLLQNILVTGFYDWGRIAGSGVPSGYTLEGYGLGLAWTAPFGLNLKSVLARRVGENPNPTAAGKDQDGSLDRNRLWLTATLPF